MAGLVIGRRRVKFRFLIVLCFILATTVLLWDWAKPPAAYANIRYGELILKDQAQALIIRQEETFTASAYGKVIYNASDGEMVSKDQMIAKLYKENFDEDVFNQLYAVQEKIISYQQDSIIDMILDSDLKKLDGDIHSIILDIQELIRNNEHQDIGRKEYKLRSLMAKKQEVLDKKSTPDDYLQSLYNQESNLLLKMKDWIIDIKTPGPGMISFYIDGLENVLDKFAVDKLTTELFRDIVNKPLPDEEEYALAKAEQPFFRLVDPLSSWFAVFEIDRADTYYQKGDNVDVQFFSVTDKLLSGVVYKTIHEKNSTLIFLELTGDVDLVINKRTASIQIEKSVQGLMVPVKALTKKKGRSGIDIWERDSHSFIETSIKGVSDGYAVVEPISENDQLKLHDQVRVR